MVTLEITDRPVLSVLASSIVFTGAKISYVNKKNKAYGVYSEYGQDYIPFDQATLIYKVRKTPKTRKYINIHEF